MLPGYAGALIAVREIGHRRYLAVIYKELYPNDDFVLSAHFTSRIAQRKAIKFPSLAARFWWRGNLSRSAAEALCASRG